MPVEPYLLIPLHRRDGTLRAHAIIDAADAHFAELRWHVNGNGYVVRMLPTLPDGSRRFAQLHRKVLGLVRDDGLEGDHINGDRLDCRRANLRIGPRASNAENVPARGGTSRYRGVSWDKRKRKWRAFAGVGGKHVHLGYFADEAAAAVKASEWRREHMPFTNEARADAA